LVSISNPMLIVLVAVEVRDCVLGHQIAAPGLPEKRKVVVPGGRG